MYESTIFNKIIKREISSDIVYEDDFLIAFKDSHPKAPVHILIVPKIVIPTINDVRSKDKYILGHMIFVASKIAKKEEIADEGYRLIMNCNKNSGQEIFHIHMHVVGGCFLGPILKLRNT